MSFHQNTSNQWALQERSESEANSSPAPLWTGVPTYAQSVGNAASFGEQIESNTNSFNEFNNDGNSDLPSQGLVGLFSNEEPSHEDESDSNEEPGVSNYLLALCYSANVNQFTKSEIIELLKSSVEELRRVFLKGVQTPAVQGKKLRVPMKILETAVRFLTIELPKYSYCSNLNRKLETLGKYINASISFIQDDILQHEKDLRDIEANVASIQKNFEILKAWNRRQSFLCGQSEKFANVVCAKDLLPQNEGPPTCGICFSTVEETSDFAVQSECSHIFCTSCISAWFETKKNCPMCRQSGLFKSKDRLLELRSRGPEPAN